MSLKIRNEQIYQATCLQIPYDLKLAAKESGINLTQTLVKALEVRLKECTGEVHASTCLIPGTPSPDPRRRGKQYEG